MTKDEATRIDMTYSLVALGDELYEHTEWDWGKIIGIFVKPEKFFCQMMAHTLERIRLLKQAVAELKIEVTDEAMVKIASDGSLVPKKTQ